MRIRTSWRPTLSALALAGALAGVQACGSDDNNTGGTGTIAVALTPTQATVQQGGSTIVTGTLTRGGGFTGTVSVTVTGTATGVTATVSQPSGSSSAQVTLNVASTAPVGDDVLTVHATGSGVSEATQTFTLHVIASGGSSGFTVSVPDSALTVVAGVNGTRSLTFVRNNFTGPITLTAEGLPTGVTAAFTAVGAGVNASVATFTVPSTVAAGTYHLILRATAAGQADATIPVTLTVLASGTTGGFAITTTPDSASTIEVGATGVKTLTFTRNGSFTGDIHLAAEGLPTGVTAAFGTVPTGNGTADVTFTVLSSAPTGTYNVVLRGTSAGQPDVVIPIHLVIAAAGTTPNFSVAISPSTLNMVQNGTSTTSVNLTRTNGFAGEVTFTATGMPSGLTATFLPSSTTTGNSVTASFTSTLALPVGTYPVTITATAPGITPPHGSAVVNVVVGEVAGAAVRLDYSACTTVQKPIWVAVQDGSGAWTKVTGASDVYTFNVTQPKGGIAVVSQNGAITSTSVFYGTQAELTAFTGGCGAGTGSGTVTGTVAGLSTGDIANVSIAGGFATVVAPATNYTLNTFFTGTQDLVGYRRNVSTPGASDRGAIRRDQPSTGVQAALDFAGAESFTPATANITLVGAGTGDNLTQSMMYETGTACVGHALYGTPVTPVAGVFTAYGVPSTAQRATDFHSLTVIDAASGSSFRSVTANFHTLADRSITFPAAVTGTVTNITGAAAYKRLQATGTLPADYTTESFTYADATGNSMTLLSTAGFQGGTAFTLAAPDLSGATGFNAAWEPATGGQATWTLSGISGGLTSGSSCTEGTTLKFGTATGTL